MSSKMLNNNVLRELALLGLKLGATAFGGPAAHISMLHHEVVGRRQWLTDQEFLDLLGATNLIPGPNSTEMVLHVGHKRGGWRGLLVAGGCFIAPAFGIVLILAWLYVQYGTTPSMEGLLWGIKPVVYAIILQAVWKLGKKAISAWILALVGMLVLVGFALGFNEIFLLIGAGLFVALWKRGFSKRDVKKAFLIVPLALKPSLSWNGFIWVPLASAPVSFLGLFLVFLKVGAVLYGSGYVLIAFLQADLVEGLRWISQQQLLDAVAVGQVTPGPLFTTATFIGYVIAGIPGAILATVGIFMPAFVFVAISGPLIPKIRKSVWAGNMLDGVNAASVGLMLAVLWPLGSAVWIDIPSILLLSLTLILLWRTRIPSVWLIGGSALFGLFSAHSSFLGWY